VGYHVSIPDHANHSFSTCVTTDDNWESQFKLRALWHVSFSCRINSDFNVSAYVQVKNHVRFQVFPGSNLSVCLC